MTGITHKRIIGVSFWFPKKLPITVDMHVGHIKEKTRHSHAGVVPCVPVYGFSKDKSSSMDFTHHPLNKQSTVDSRYSKQLNQSTVDYTTNKLRTKLNDPELGERMVALGLLKLGEGKLTELSDYVLRKSDNPGKAFVSLCDKLIKEKI